MDNIYQQNLKLLKQEYESRKSRITSLPTKLDLPVSGSCNLRCFMCGIGVSPEKYKAGLNDDVFKRCYELFPYLNHVELNGAEIFAERGAGTRTDEVIERAGDFPQLKLGGATNGILLDKGRTNAIVDKFDELSFSMDSVTPKIYESIRVGASFGVLKDNLACINEQKAKLGRSPRDYPRLHFSAIIMDRTYRDLMELVKFVGEMGGVFLALRPLRQDVSDVVWEEVQREDIFSDKLKVAEYLEIAANAKKLAGKMGIKIVDKTYAQIRHNFPELLQARFAPRNKREQALCDLGWKSFYVNNQGQVSFGPCSHNIIGNLNTQSAKTVWHSKTARRERKNLIKGNHANCISSRCIKGGGTDGGKF